jgi:hypothetical protein
MQIPDYRVCTGHPGSSYPVTINDDLFHRLETVRFFRIFTGEGDTENTGCSNTEPRGLKARVLP